MASYRDVRPAAAYCSDESSSDSDADDDQPWKRRKTGGPPQRVRREVGAGQPGGIEKPVAPMAPGGTGLGASKQRRRNNVWGQVALEQTEALVAQEMDGFDMDLPRSRDVESYDYRLGWDEGDDGGGACRSQLGAPSISKLESGRPQGLKRGFRETEEDSWLADQPGDEVDRQDDASSVSSRKPVRERLGAREPGPRQTAKARLGSRSHSPSSSTSSVPDSPMRFVSIDPSRSHQEIMGELAYSLQESKRELIVRVVNVLGVDKSLELWRQTADVERSGGMLVMNGSRRRSPGGVFLQLMKTDPEVTKAQVREIFAEERKKDSDLKHKRDRRRRKLVAQSKDVEDRGEGSGLKAEKEDGGCEESADRGRPAGDEAPRDLPAAVNKSRDGNSDMEDGEVEDPEEAETEQREDEMKMG